MFWDQLMLCNVYQEFCFFEMFNSKGVTHFLHCLFGEWCNIHSKHHDGVSNTFCSHTIGVYLDGFHSNLFVFWEEAKKLIGFIVCFFLYFGDVVCVRRGVEYQYVDSYRNSYSDSHSFYGPTIVPTYH